jgi:signal transduction histidine kinase
LFARFFTSGLSAARLRGLCMALLLCCCAGDTLAQGCAESVDGQTSLRGCVHALPDAVAAQVMAAVGLPAPAGGDWYRIDWTSAGGKRLLDLGIPDAYRVRVYQEQGGQLRSVLALDAASNYTDRPVQHRRLMAPLSLARGTATVYVYFHTHGKTPMLARLWDADQLNASDTEAHLFSGLVLGIMLAMVPVALLGLGGERARGYRMYGVVVLTNTLFVAQVEGYNFAFLWPHAPAWNMLAPGALGGLALMAHIGFAMDFLQMRTRMPQLYRWHRALLWGCALTLAAHLIYGLDALLTVQMLAYSGFGCAVALVGVRRRVEAARFYLLGTSVLMGIPLLLLVFVILALDPLPFLPVLAYPKFGCLGETLLFGAAVASQLGKFNARLADGRLRRLAETEQLLLAEQTKLAALEQANERLLRLASASHDIAQPLASLRLAFCALAPAGGAVAEHIDTTLAYAQSLLKDLIEQARRDQRAPEPIVLSTMFGQLGQAFQVAADDKGLRLSVRASALRVSGSSLLLYRILANLLANAVRHTPSGRIVLGARRRAGGVEIQLFDTGPGIPADARERMLRPFEQGGQGDGFGLGLFIVNNLCQQCGYALRIASTPGRGSCFAVFIPSTLMC